MGFEVREVSEVVPLELPVQMTSKDGSYLSLLVRSSCCHRTLGGTNTHTLLYGSQWWTFVRRLPMSVHGRQRSSAYLHNRPATFPSNSIQGCTKVCMEFWLNLNAVAGKRQHKSVVASMTVHACGRLTTCCACGVCP